MTAAAPSYPSGSMSGWAKRLVRMVYDSDVTEKPQVQAAMVRMRQFLQARGARVQVVCLKQRALSR
jgi:Domain of unknown function (DUF3854)